MIKNATKDLENVSAYLDDALTPTEKDLLEQKLQASPSLRESLSDFRDMKEKVNSLKPLPADPYFETRLMERLKREQSVVRSPFSFRKPVIAFAALCIIVMGVFKFQPDFFEKFIHDNKSSITDFYAKNLKPLLYATNLTHDDIFNFALNKYLPINKGNNQMLRLGTNPAGEEFIEVKYANALPAQMSFDSFIEGLGLTGSQKKDVNKILEKYSDKIASAVLVNDKNTVAVNSQLWKYREQLRTEILSYASNANESARKKILEYDPNFHKNIAMQVANNTSKSGKHSNFYYCISPDSVFGTSLDIDNENLMLALQQQKEALQNGQSALRNVNITIQQGMQADANVNSGRHLRVVSGNNGCRIVIPQPMAPDVNLPDMDEMSRALDSVFSRLGNVSFNFKIDPRGRKQMYSFDFKNLPDQLNKSYKGKGKGFPKMMIDSSSGDYRLFFRDPNTGKDYTLPNLEQQYMIDSLQNLLRSNIGNSKNGEAGVQEFKKEMEKMKKDMEKMKKELKEKQKGNNEIKEINNSWEI